VIVAHAQKVQLITKSNRKDDRHDARTLARLARIDPALLGPVRHRSAQAQIHLTVIRARAELVSARTALVNAARGLVKSYGQRLPKCGTQQVSRELAAQLSAELGEVLEPLLRQIESLNERIQEYEVRMEKIAGESEPQKKISKEGDRYLRTMMVQGAHYILGPFGEDSDLRRWGRKLAERGGKTPRNERWSRWRESWRYCSIGCR